MAELTQALIHARRQRKAYNTDEIIEEFADVNICLAQLEIIIGIAASGFNGGNSVNELMEAEEAKLRRLDCRLEPRRAQERARQPKKGLNE
jgi:hypothetical protein